MKISGKGGSVMYGAVVIAEMDTWAMSGFTQAVTAEPTAFGDIIKKYEAIDAGDPGTISFSGSYDPSNADGQRVLATICKAGTKLTTLFLYVNTNTWWKVASGGEIIVTKAEAITLPRNAYGTISFEGQVSGAAMEQIGTGT